MNLICKIFGHKYTINPKSCMVGNTIYVYGQSNWWNCLRCDEPKKIYFSDIEDEGSGEIKINKLKDKK